MSVSFVLGLSAQLSAGTVAMSQAGPGSAVPADPVQVILHAFRTHEIVALSEGQHWNEQGHAFRLLLIRDARFANLVNDVVVEFGSARYQSQMDRFVNGEDVPYDSLRLAWENTTSPNEVWDVPMYEEFFRTVRAINASLPGSRRVRVILSDPPIDWEQVRDKDDVLHWLDQRDTFAAQLVRQEVLSKRRRALLIFGDGHLWRKGETTLISLLEDKRPGSVFTIAVPTTAKLSTIQSNVATWPIPSITLLRGNVIGAASFAPFYELDGDPWKSLRMEDMFDALLYLGPPEAITLAWISAARCRDTSYIEKRLARLRLVPWGEGEIGRIRRRCAALRD